MTEIVPQPPTEVWALNDPPPDAPRVVSYSIPPEEMIRLARVQHEQVQKAIPIMERYAELAEENKLNFEKQRAAMEKAATAIESLASRITDEQLATVLLPAVVQSGQYGLAAMSKVRETIAAFRIYFKVTQ